MPFDTCWVSGDSSTLGSAAGEYSSHLVLASFVDQVNLVPAYPHTMGVDPELCRFIIYLDTAPVLS
eukprot:859569-Amphidinium_carterae.1